MALILRSRKETIFSHLTLDFQEMDKLTLMEGKPEDKEEIIDFLNQHFLHHEPMNISIGLCEAGYRYHKSGHITHVPVCFRMPFFDAMVKGHLELEDTVVVIARGEGRKLMGLTVFIMESR